MILTIYSFGQIAFILTLLGLFRSWFRLRFVPGPFLAGFTDLWRTYHMFRGDYAETLWKLHERYGSLVRTGPNNISIGDPLEIEPVYRTNPVHDMGEIYKATTGYVQGKKINGLESLRDEKLHTALRRSIAPSFTLNAVVGFEPQIDNAIEELMCHVDQLKTWDITTWILYFAMDSFNNIAFSEDLGFMKNGCDIGGTLSSITLSFRYFCWFSTFPNLGMGLSFILSFLMGANNPLVLLSASRANSRYNTNDPYDTRNDLLAHYVKIAKEKPDIVTLDTVTGLVLTNILAGADTTSLAIVTLIYHLLKNPSCLARLQMEINSAANEGRLGYPPQWKELSELRYLDATIKESLRLQDLLRFNMDRVVGSNGLQLCGTNLPPGTNVGALQHVIHRNRDVYGHDAEIFNPDRWLRATQSQVKTMERAAVWFGHGKRICIGQNIGKLAITKFISTLLMRFNIHDTDPNAKLAMITRCNVATPNVPYFVTVERRRNGT